MGPSEVHICLTTLFHLNVNLIRYDYLGMEREAYGEYSDVTLLRVTNQVFGDTL